MKLLAGFCTVCTLLAVFVIWRSYSEVWSDRKTTRATPPRFILPAVPRAVDIISVPTRAEAAQAAEQQHSAELPPPIFVQTEPPLPLPEISITTETPSPLPENLSPTVAPSPLPDTNVEMPDSNFSEVRPNLTSNPDPLPPPLSTPQPEAPPPSAEPHTAVTNTPAITPSPLPLPSSAPEVTETAITPTPQPVQPLPSPPTDVKWAGDPDRRDAERVLAGARDALARDPSHPSALRDAIAAAKLLERWDEVRTYQKLLLDVEPGNSGARFDYAATLLRLRLWAPAVAELKTVVSEQPGNVDALFNLAVAHQAAGHLAEAREAWSRVLEQRPDDVEALAHRGEVWLDYARWDEAAQDLRAAHEMQPENLATALNLSLALWRSGRTPEARTVATGIVDRHPRNVDALNRLAFLSWTLAQSQPGQAARYRDEAFYCCQRSLAIEPDQPEMRELLREITLGGGSEGR